MTKNKPLLIETWEFIKRNKVWWLAPIIVLLLIAGLLILFGQSAVVNPFIYALF